MRSSRKLIEEAVTEEQTRLEIVAKAQLLAAIQEVARAEESLRYNEERFNDLKASIDNGTWTPPCNYAQERRS